jgi:CSLREA domain-containing protein
VIGSQRQGVKHEKHSHEGVGGSLRQRALCVLAMITVLLAGPPAPLFAATSQGVLSLLPASFIVNSTDDAPDATPGDGACATTTAMCTLRAALDEANALPGASTIALPAGTYVRTIGPLAITADVSIHGGGASATIVDGKPAHSVVEIASTAHVTISSVTIQHGQFGPRSDVAAGISNAGTLTLTNSTVTANMGGGQPGWNFQHGGRDPSQRDDQPQFRFRRG